MAEQRAEPKFLYPQSLSIVKVISPLKYKRELIGVVERNGEIEPIAVDPRITVEALGFEERRNNLEFMKNKLSGLISSINKSKITKGNLLSTGKTEEEVMKFLNSVYDTDGKELEGLLERMDHIERRVAELKGLIRTLVELSTVGIATTTETAILKDSKHTKTFVGAIIPNQLNTLYWYMSEVTNNRYHIQDGYLDENEIVAIVTVLNEDAEPAEVKLKSMNFIRIDIPKDGDFDGLSAIDCEQEIAELGKDEENLVKKVSNFTVEKGFNIIGALEATEIELSRINVEMKMRRTRDTAILWAWIPNERKEEFRTEVHAATDGSSIVDFRAGQFDPSVTPTFTKNANFMKPMRGLVTSFGTPSHHEVDPYPFVRFLYPVLFAIMFADVGHGLILFLLGFRAYRKKQTMEEIPKGISGYMYGGAELIMLMGATSFFMGFAFNSVFGDETILWNVAPIKAIFEHTTWSFFFTVEDNVIERNYVNFLIFSFIVGALIILLGLAINLYQLKNYRHSDDELYAALALTGVYVSAILTAVFAVVGLSILVTASILLILFNIFATLYIEYRHAKIDGVMLGVDHLVSLLSNTFSFGRLLAMNTIHFVLAFLPYLFLDKAFPGVLNHHVNHALWDGTNTVIIIWIIGAILGALIVVPVETVFSTLQSLRLNWVEFFGKFYKGNGVEFKPIIVNRIHTTET